MSKHIGRKRRWTRQMPGCYASTLGTVVYEQNAWFALLDYRTQDGGAAAMPRWTPHHRRLGPFKRPRNAMVALEEEATFLRNRHKGAILLGRESEAPEF